MTTDRVVSTKVRDMHHVTNPTNPDTMERTKSDYHVNTTCAGNNMTLFSYTGYNCNVIGFHSNLESIANIPVVTAVTAYNDPISGTTVMLVFNQTLWFGISMEQYLIATNQVFSHGVQLSDDTYDQNRPLGIVDHESDWYIPFTLQQYFSGVETKSPTIEDYNDCPNIIYITSYNKWDLSDIQLPHHSSIIGDIECSHTDKYTDK